MKKFLLAVAVLCMGTMAFAGPNAGGVLLAHDANLLMSATNGSVSVCGQGVVPAGWADADTEIDGAGNLGGDAAVFKVYAAFETVPRLMGLTWSISYPADLILPNWGMCGDFELNDTGWPGTGTGSTVTWNTVQQGMLIPVYWFAGYTYGGQDVLALGPHPSQGGYFGDDTIPAILDPIHGYGTLGFDTPGSVVPPIGGEPTGACCDPATGLCTITTQANCAFNWHPEFTSCDPNPCPPPPIYGACCNPDTGGCTITLEADCLAPNTWHPEWTSCDPNPCPPPPVPAEKSTWGSIKANYR